MIIYTKDNTKVIDSYKITDRNEIRKQVLWIIEERKIRKYPITRTVNSYIREWVGHNRLYELGIAKEHTKDVDLQEPSSLLNELIWLILGGI